MDLGTPLRGVKKYWKMLGTISVRVIPGPPFIPQHNYLSFYLVLLSERSIYALADKCNGVRSFHAIFQNHLSTTSRIVKSMSNVAWKDLTPCFTLISILEGSGYLDCIAHYCTTAGDESICCISTSAISILIQSIK